jgi:ribosomal protein L16 Arg81 hydroxylase
VQVNSYASFGQTTVGFDAHWDDHDVIVVQLEGRKRSVRVNEFETAVGRNT